MSYDPVSVMIIFRFTALRSQERLLLPASGFKIPGWPDWLVTAVYKDLQQRNFFATKQDNHRPK